MVMIEVDYKSATHAVIEAQKSSPYEIGLGWAVTLKGADFIGKRALKEEQSRGSTWTFVGVQLDWHALEALSRQIVARGSAPEPLTPVSMLYHKVQAQALVMSYADVFFMMTVVLLGFLPLIPLLRSSSGRSHPPAGE